MPIMKELIKELENILIENGNPILKYMDVEASRKSEEDIKNSFKSLGLECCPELLELYQWKSGCDRKTLFEFEDAYKPKSLCSFGNLVAYPISAEMYKEYLQEDEYWFTNDCMVPIISYGVYEDPILINLNSKSKDFKAIFYYSPGITGENPEKIYDTIESWLETIIQCYKSHIYHIDNDGYLVCDSDAEAELTRKLNPNSEFWF